MLKPHSSRLLVIVFIATVHFVLADVFVGCFDPRVLPMSGGLVYDSYLDNCQDICRLSGTEYSYSWPDPEDQGDFPTFRICQCGFAQPDGQYLIPTSLCDYPNVQVFYLPSLGDWSYSGCLYLPGTPNSPFNSPVQCLNECSRYPIAFTVYIDSLIFCSCTFDIPNPDDLQTVCGIGDWFVYSKTVLPSGFVGKRRLGYDVQEKKSCPEGSRACRIGPGSASQSDYECIAIGEELESCGGCLFGDVTPGGRLTELGGIMNGAGTDCTQIAGVRSDGVTCVGGGCLVFACEDGYHLVDGMCIPD